METKKIRVALVGCGGMARKYRFKYNRFPNAVLRLVVDADEELARRVGEELGAEWSTDFSRALAGDIDLVDISTPNFLHCYQATQVLKSGKHLLLQKPMATTLEEARQILDAAAQTSAKAGVYMSMLDNPAFHDVKRMVQEGYLGRITNLYCRSAHRGGLNPAPGDWRRSVEKTGGGAFIQLAVHFINLSKWMLGERFVQVGALSRNRLCPDIGGDDITVAICETESGIPVTLEACYASDLYRFAVYGTKGFVSVTDDVRIEMKLEDDFEGCMISYKAGSGVFMIPNTGFDELKIYPEFEQHQSFINSITEDRPVSVSLESAFEDLKTVKTAYEAAKEGRFIRLS